LKVTATPSSTVGALALLGPVKSCEAHVRESFARFVPYTSTIDPGEACVNAPKSLALTTLVTVGQELPEAHVLVDADAACEMVNDCPVTMMAPDRAFPVTLAATMYPIVPFPVPLNPDVSVSQLAFDEADQPQLLVGKLTLMLPEPPVDATLKGDAGLNETMHPGGGAAPAWIIA